VDAGHRAGGFLQFRDFAFDQRGIEGELGIGMRGGDYIGGAGLGRQAQHGNGVFEGLGAIVETRQNMAVNIDQLLMLLQQRVGCKFVRDSAGLHGT